MNVRIFGIDLTLDPIAFSIGGWNVYWYGIIIAAGFLLAVLYAMKNAARFNLNTDKMLDIALITVPLAILCARIYYIIFDGTKIESISDFFGFSSSSGIAGIAIYGGVIGAFTFGPLICKLFKVKILDMFDIASIGFIIGQCVGRWGNFVNQEAFGTFTGSSWWGMESTRTNSYMHSYLVKQAEAAGATSYEIAEITGEGLVHPCFLYESLWCLAGFFVLHYFSKKRKFSGQVFLMYCAWYGFGRAFIEMLRTDSLMLGPIRVSSLLSFIICIGAIVLLIIYMRKYKEKELLSIYTPVFENGEGSEIEEEIEDVEEASEETEVLEIEEISEEESIKNEVD